jgi:undecaprenyl-diphosphatase
MRGSARDWNKRDLLLGGVSLLVLLLGFAALAKLVLSGWTQPFDEWVLSVFRKTDALRTPVGPAWLQGAALDVTALGSGVVLGLVTFAIVVFLALQGLRRTAIFVGLASTGGWVLNYTLKEIFQRPRPDVVPHLREVMSLSFPSGHAMTSAAVYLTLGVLLMRISKRRLTKVYCMAMAVLVTVLVGSSRVYLGVHYPTDVLAGWIAGASWALLCWFVERALERPTGMQQEQQQKVH